MRKMDKILIVDDDEGLVHFLTRFFSRKEYEVLSCNSGTAALEAVGREPFDLILLDYKMPGKNGLETLKEIRRLQVKTPIIVMTAYGTMDTAIEAMKLGAYDYLLKPFDRNGLERIARDALEVNRLMKEVVSFPAHSLTSARVPKGEIKIIGNHTRMQEVYKLIGQVANKDVTVLITGESGTGKELVARALYHHSDRKNKPFLGVNCAAIPETLFESELFGYERGAFTGAERTHIGKFERCHGGTLFFDEIAEMPLSTQAKLLRALQYGEIERVGAEQPLKVDVRVLVATNKNLERAVEQGRFREDLYWRLKIISIHLPPLRERPEDIPALVDYFLVRFGEEYKSPIRRIEDGALAKLKSHAWPGNVRELENTVRRAVVLSSGDVIREEHLRFDSGGHEPSSPEWDKNPWARVERKLEELIPDLLQVGGEAMHESIIDMVERILLSKVLEQCGNNQVKAARVLGVSRNTLRHRMKKFDFLPPSE
ncbi:two component, sigma54 specific, transcriptional regulator, Fis family [Syntrophobacter fumaroxidans MPOB]|uniref:Two component, sigma54 specific, transcriptional regulator, Fis family n=2 Tax=Syntrophobacter TaxID=29526 RepID=A0LND9_SYNFM|nr:two component, sigma54 specific, transcriptional regulator, Fis family [Syntrophobacter fumaroxidans MPOB]